MQIYSKCVSQTGERLQSVPRFDPLVSTGLKSHICSHKNTAFKGQKEKFVGDISMQPIWRRGANITDQFSRVSIAITCGNA